MNAPAPIATTVGLTIINHRAGEVAEVVLSGPPGDREWPAIERQLLTLIQVRQPTELWLDPEDTGELVRFPTGLTAVADALAQFGGTLVAARSVVPPTQP